MATAQETKLEVLNEINTLKSRVLALTNENARLQAENAALQIPTDPDEARKGDLQELLTEIKKPIEIKLEPAIDPVLAEPVK